MWEVLFYLVIRVYVCGRQFESPTWMRHAFRTRRFASVVYISLPRMPLWVNTYFFNQIWHCWVWRLCYLKLIVLLLPFVPCWEKTRNFLAIDRGMPNSTATSMLVSGPPGSRDPLRGYRASRWSRTHGNTRLGETTAVAAGSKWTYSSSRGETSSHLSKLLTAPGTLRNSLDTEQAEPCIFTYLAGLAQAHVTDGVRACHFCSFLGCRKATIKYNAHQQLHRE